MGHECTCRMIRRMRGTLSLHKARIWMCLHGVCMQADERVSLTLQFTVQLYSNSVFSTVLKTNKGVSVA